MISTRIVAKKLTVVYVCTSACLSVRLSVCLSVCLWAILLNPSTVQLWHLTFGRLSCKYGEKDTYLNSRKRPSTSNGTAMTPYPFATGIFFRSFLFISFSFSFLLFPFPMCLSSPASLLCFSVFVHSLSCFCFFPCFCICFCHPTFRFMHMAFEKTQFVNIKKKNKIKFINYKPSGQFCP